MTTDIEAVLGADASLLDHKCAGVPQDLLHLPGPGLHRPGVRRDRPQPGGAAQPRHAAQPRSPGGTGYLSILPVDQGIEHSAARVVRAEPAVLRPGQHRRAGHRGRLQRGRHRRSACSARWRAATRTGSRSSSRSTTTSCSPTRTSSTRSCSHRSTQAFDLGAVGVGATIYFGSDESTRQLAGGGRGLRSRRTSSGMFTVLWCYLRNNAFKKDGVDYHVSADLTGQANHLGVTIEADIIKQKLPENNGGYNALSTSARPVNAGLRRADDRPPDRPLPLAGRQLLHGPHRPDQLRRRVARARATSPTRCAPR